jgi:hypothetical protein
MNIAPATTFAIGCFHFGLKKIYPNGMNGSDYIKELQSSLRSIPNISNIEVSTFDDFEELTVSSTQKLSDLNGEDFFPYASEFLQIDFDIYIPKRLQDELRPGISENINTEKFRIHIEDSYHFPVTFIEPIEAGSKSSPSSSIFIIRKFLEQQFTEKNFEFIRFDFLGPSPFHADFYLMEDANEKLEKNDYDINGYYVNHISTKGYNAFDMRYKKNTHPSLEESKEALFLELSSEAGLFYSLVHDRILQTREWEKLEGLVDYLLETSKATGFKGVWNKVFTLSKQVQDIIILLSEFESNQIWASSIRKINCRQLINARRRSYLKAYIDEELDEFPDYPVRQIKDIIDLLENRRSKTVDNTIVVIAAVIGGIIGSLLTLLITST